MVKVLVPQYYWKCSLIKETSKQKVNHYDLIVPICNLAD